MDYETYGIGGITQDKLEDLKKMYKLWLEAFPSHCAGDREIEYDEQIVAYPRVTSEDLTANHAAGLPLARERIVRCKDCKYAWAHDGCIECLRHFTQAWDYHNDRPTHTVVRPDGFCSWAERRGD